MGSTLIEHAKEAISNFVINLNRYLTTHFLEEFGVEAPQVYTGTIATGDQFIKDPAHHGALKFKDENVLAVEMEGAAVAQVCREHKIPFVLIRTLSDKADHGAHIDFPRFIVKMYPLEKPIYQK